MLTAKDTPEKVEKDAFRIAAELAFDPYNRKALHDYARAFAALVKAHQDLLEAAQESRVELPRGQKRDPLYYPALAGAIDDLGLGQILGATTREIGDKIVTVTAQTRWPIPKRWYATLNVRER